MRLYFINFGKLRGPITYVNSVILEGVKSSFGRISSISSAKLVPLLFPSFSFYVVDFDIGLGASKNMHGWKP